MAYIRPKLGLTEAPYYPPGTGYGLFYKPPAYGVHLNNHPEEYKSISPPNPAKTVLIKEDAPS